MPGEGGWARREPQVAAGDREGKWGSAGTAQEESVALRRCPSVRTSRDFVPQSLTLVRLGGLEIRWWGDRLQSKDGGATEGAGAGGVGSGPAARSGGDESCCPLSTGGAAPPAEPRLGKHSFLGPSPSLAQQGEMF